jgi:hypothetical protein
MVWPILISVAVTPRISAADKVAGKISNAIAPSAPHPVAIRIGPSSPFVSAALDGAARLARLSALVASEDAMAPTWTPTIITMEQTQVTAEGQ